MGAPTGDKVAPSIVLLVGLLAVFIALTQAMSSTINSNLQTDWTTPSETPSPDYLAMFQNATYSYWEPNPYFLDGDVVTLTTDYPLSTGKADRDELFTNSVESAFPINFVGVSGHFGESTAHHNEFFFFQHGGWLGMKTWDYLLRYPEDFTAVFSNASGDPEIIAYTSVMHLRHDYSVIFSGYDESSLTLNEQILGWDLNITVCHVIDATASANPWTIIGQFFTLSLPGIPTWLNALLMAPILVIAGIMAFVLIRGALPW